MISLRSQAAFHGATSVAGLRSKLSTQRSNLRSILQVSTLHKSFRLLNGATGPLGIPAGAVAFSPDGKASRNYRGGTLVALADKEAPTWDFSRRVQIRYVGFQCNDESDELSEHDEPYFIMSVIGPKQSNTVMKGPYSVDDGDKISDTAVICDSFTPNELVLSTVIRENDQGTPEDAKNLILKRAKEISEVAGTVYGVVSGDGGDGKAISGWIDKTPAVGTVASWFAGIFGMGDDQVGFENKVLFPIVSNTKLPETADIGPIQEFKGNKYNYKTSEIGSADEGRYEVYYMITVFQEPAPPVPV